MSHGHEHAVDVVMPQMGVSVSEGTVTKWLKARRRARSRPTSRCSRSRPTRSTPRCRAPASGVVGEILVQEGETVDVGTVLAVIAPGRAGAAAAPAEAPPAPATQEAADASAEAATCRARTGAAAPAPAAPAQPAASAGNGRTFVSPVVARIAAEHGVDPNRVQGTGTGGRVTKKDILAFIESAAAAPAEPPAPRLPRLRPPAPPAAAAPTPLQLPPPAPAACAARRAGRAARASRPRPSYGQARPRSR